ncbi:hypothetical protein JOC36_001516 [Weissella uvarum]|uniref:hypothetical protein n=1 Tax=Weissella uvarum TaxID=1479233 RepID=UPI001960C65A|nr:hypothetical protein [Weissella uvarum]MBM7617923.1 hypothetical protein [Weissella uvarum]MCM0596081.1 hypothetical protein [Weissella uvarum]
MDEEEQLARERAKYFFEHDYHDRGMVKWQGFYLSDHVEDVEKYTNKRARAMEQQELKEMTTEEITQVLFDAYRNHQQVAYQLNRKDIKGMYSPVLKGKVNGYIDDEAFIGAQTVTIADINYVELID